MRFRKLIDEVLVVSPLVFILCITVQARTRVDSFVPYEYSRTLEQRICAYVEPVRMVECLLQKGVMKADSRQLRGLAPAWRDLTAEGVLRPLPPEAPDDSTKDGIKAQIQRAAEVLATSLQYLSRKEAERGSYYMAASDTVLAMEAVQGVKYSDLHSVGMLSVRQSASLVLLKDVASKLTPEQKSNIAARLSKLERGERSLAEAVLAQQRVRRIQDPVESETESEDVKLMMVLAKGLDAGDVMKPNSKLVAKLLEACQEPRQVDVLPDFRFAWKARRNGMNNLRMVDRILRA